MLSFYQNLTKSVKLLKMSIFKQIRLNYLIKNSISTLPQLDYDYLCNPSNTDEIKSRIKRRKGVGDIDLIISLYNQNNKEELIKEAIKIPNKSHPKLINLGIEPKIVKTIREIPNESNQKTFEEIASRLRLIKTDTSHYTGPRSYYLFDTLSKLELALVNYSISKLIKSGFEIISVPDVLPQNIIDYCGLNTEGERTQVYKLNKCEFGDDLCLSGTAEMGIAYYLQNKEFKEDHLPLKLAAVSRCYRAETSRVSEEKGLYRVHQFTKVEMFGVTTQEGSSKLLEEFRNYEEETFSELGLILRTLDMPECELGAQAYRKYDVEAYLPGKKRWGEISSTSDCTDYQARRLNIKYDNKFAHTVNGTACAVPRMIIALIETHQKKKYVEIPEVLVPFLGYSRIEKSDFPVLKMYRHK